MCQGAGNTNLWYYFIVSQCGLIGLNKKNSNKGMPILCNDYIFRQLSYILKHNWHILAYSVTHCIVPYVWNNLNSSYTNKPIYKYILHLKQTFLFSRIEAYLLVGVVGVRALSPSSSPSLSSILLSLALSFFISPGMRQRTLAQNKSTNTSTILFDILHCICIVFTWETIFS